MPARHWRLHLGRLIFGAVAVMALGLVSGHLGLALLAGALAYLVWLLFNTLRLYHWLRLGQGSPPESLGIWSDIFDRIDELQKRNLAQQHQDRAVIEEFQGMSDALPDATLVLDPEDNLVWFNDAAHRLLGLREREDLGQPVTNLLREPDFANWIAVGDQVQQHFAMASPVDGHIRLSIRAVMLRDDQKLLVIRDVTDFHNLENIRRDFVANVSHELRTPLTVLLGYLETISDQGPEEVIPIISRMQEQALHMQDLLTDLLELSRLQSAPEESARDNLPVDMPAILMRLQEQAEELSQGEHEILFQVEPDLCLLGHAVDLESAFRNLIGNAIHYTPAGGKITVRWERREEGLCFSVSDTGIGIPTRDIPRLTERFYRVGSDRSRHSGGTGLGLSIVKHVLNTHDAKLVIESELGEGSLFICVFPSERLKRCKVETEA